MSLAFEPKSANCLAHCQPVGIKSTVSSSELSHCDVWLTPNYLYTEALRCFR
jgi:hypothetical protein